MEFRSALPHGERPNSAIGSLASYMFRSALPHGERRAPNNMNYGHEEPQRRRDPARPSRHRRGRQPGRKPFPSRFQTARTRRTPPARLWFARSHDQRVAEVGDGLGADMLHAAAPVGAEIIIAQTVLLRDRSVASSSRLERRPLRRIDLDLEHRKLHALAVILARLARRGAAAAPRPAALRSRRRSPAPASRRLARYFQNHGG